VRQKVGPRTRGHNYSVKSKPIFKNFTGGFLESAESVSESYEKERGCLMYIARLANTLLKDEESARGNHVLACNFAKYSPI